MRILGIIFIIALVAFGFYYFNQGKDIRNITVAELETLMEEKGDDIELLDVRTMEEIKASSTIGDARHIDFYNEDFKLKLDELDRKKTYVVYCASGGRSGNSLPIMEEMGFEKVYNLEGGYNAWKSR